MTIVVAQDCLLAYCLTDQCCQHWWWTFAGLVHSESSYELGHHRTVIFVEMGSAMVSCWLKLLAANFLLAPPRKHRRYFRCSFVAAVALDFVFFHHPLVSAGGASLCWTRFLR